MLCEAHERPTGRSKGNQGTTRGKEKILLTSVGMKPPKKYRSAKKVQKVQKTQHNHKCSVNVKKGQFQ